LSSGKLAYKLGYECFFKKYIYTLSRCYKCSSGETFSVCMSQVTCEWPADVALRFDIETGT